MKLKIDIGNFSPEYIFLFFALTFGLAITLITPPFQTPDEFHHFYRAYQVADGQFTGIQQDNRLGGYIPANMVNASHPFLLVRRREQSASNEMIAEFLHKPLKADSAVFTDFPAHAIFTPFCYLPQVATIFIMAKLHFSVGYIFYGCRLITFLIWVVAIFYSIRIIPVFKKLFMLLAILPMSLSVNSSISADVITNICAFVLIAYSLRCVFSDTKFTIKNFFVIALLVFLLASTKLLYALLLVFFLIIPKDKFSSRKAFYIQFISLVVIALLVSTFWASIINHLYIPFSNYNPAYRSTGIDEYEGADVHLQAQFILNHKLHYIRELMNSFFLRGSFIRNCMGYVGILGWFDLGLSSWVYYLAWAVILFTAITEDTNGNIFTNFHKAILFVAVIIMLILINLSQYLVHSVIGGDLEILQGRYFIPVLPLFFMILNRRKFSNPQMQRLINPVIIISMICILTSTLFTLYSRYY